LKGEREFNAPLKWGLRKEYLGVDRKRKLDTIITGSFSAGKEPLERKRRRKSQCAIGNSLPPWKSKKRMMKGRGEKGEDF